MLHTHSTQGYIKKIWHSSQQPQQATKTMIGTKMLKKNVESARAVTCISKLQLINLPPPPPRTNWWIKQENYCISLFFKYHFIVDVVIVLFLLMLQGICQESFDFLGNVIKILAMLSA